MSGLEMKYFVLKPKGPGAYAEASRLAMIAYASHIKRENRALSEDLRKWALTEKGLSITEETE